MSVLVFIDQSEGHIKKSSYEAACYGAKLAELAGTTAEGVILGIVKDDPASLGNFGLKKVHIIKRPVLDHFDARVFTKVISEVTEKLSAKIIVFSNNSSGKAIAPCLSARLRAGLVSGAIALPDLSNGFIVRKTVFSGKAFANISIKTDIKIISLNVNSFPLTRTEALAEVSELNLPVEAGKVEVASVNLVVGEVSLSEANIVVSGGRGLKGPENWALVTDLAKLLGAATACSRPVADILWRPHHEHVGQTGLAIAPNLYFAIGISGAIQHLAGVNRSKTIVVINKDPEAPFFKAADYGIVGDAFEVMPKIIEAVRKLKSA